MEMGAKPEREERRGEPNADVRGAAACWPPARVATRSSAHTPTLKRRTSTKPCVTPPALRKTRSSSWPVEVSDRHAGDARRCAASSGRL